MILNKVDLKQIARDLIRVGINCLPTKVKEKYPKVPSWKEFQDRMLSEDEINRFWHSGIDGIGVITGKISGNLECIDIDNKLDNAADILDELKSHEEVEAILMNKCLIERTQNGGYHIFYRAEKIDGNLKLAMKSDRAGNKICVIETRGEGGFAVISPSIGYEVLWGKWEALMPLSEDERDLLINYCKSLNEEWARKDYEEKDASKYETKPWEVYNNSQEGIAEAKSLLVSSGWSFVKTTRNGIEYWRRPGAKTKGIDATIRDNVFYCFTTNGHPFEHDHAYKPFGILVLLKFAGEKRSAIKYLLENGFGKLKSKEDRINRSDNSDNFIKVVYRAKMSRLEIDRNNFINFLVKNGFGKIYVGKEAILIKITNNRVKEVNETKIKDFVVDYINSLEDPIIGEFNRADVRNVLLKDHSDYFSKKFLEFLPTYDLNFKRDTREEAYFFFRNCWVRVNDSGYQELDYSKMDGVIWEDQIIQRDFQRTESDECDFKQFIKNICRGEEDRYLALVTAIGYLLHTYKDSGNAKAIVFCDEGDKEALPDEANGRSGKSLVAKAIGKLRKIFIQDARNFNFDKTFAFQSIDLDTQLIVFNDCPKNFRFDKLFAIITDSITVEKKNRDEFVIPFEQSPKILITTNYTIQDEGTSSKDRKFEIEFSNYYNINHRPVDDFEIKFFDDWIEEKEYEWVKFDNFMLSCVVTYLQLGLTPYKFRNLLRKQITQGTAVEFYEFMENVPRDRELANQDLFDQFVEQYPEFKDKINVDKFGKWISKYVLVRNIKAGRIRIANRRGWIFYSGKEIEETNDNNNIFS